MRNNWDFQLCKQVSYNEKLCLGFCYLKKERKKLTPNRFCSRIFWVIIVLCFSLFHMLKLKDDICLISVIARGVRDMTRRKSIHLFCKGKTARIFYLFIYLQETHSVAKDAMFWSKQWGDDAYFSHGTSRSAGVAILQKKKKFKGQVASYIADESVHWLMLILNIDGLKLILINIYGYYTKKIMFCENK